MVILAAVVQDHRCGFVVVGVARATGMDVAAKVRAKQCEVTDTIENLVAGTLVGETQRIVNRPIGAKDDQVLVCQSESESLLFEGGNLVFEYEGSAAGDVAGKRLGVQHIGAILRSNG